MAKSIPFGAGSTADHVLAGIDLTGKHIVVTGCTSGLGFETMSALTANGAHVIALARTLAGAAAACAEVGPFTTPIACDLGDLQSIATAAAAIQNLRVPLDAIVTNAGVASLPTLQTRYGVEQQFLVNHLGHFYLLNELLDSVRNGTGRIVIVSSHSSKTQAPAEGVMFDNLDGHRFYQPSMFYGQSKLANALHAKELSRRLQSRGIAVNSLHPGATRGTHLNRKLTLPLKMRLRAAQLFMRPASYGAATQTLLAGSPRVSGISGKYWSNCQIAEANPLVEDVDLARRLWDVSHEILAQHTARAPTRLLEAA
ncbi:MAG: SDR family NAD(P)-dependent oxidoreductase [Pseudomonadota bacterium]|nr:SDR family NAD(P)-dependent oxidoreductase [Pseudomonadota bacterium]